MANQIIVESGTGNITVTTSRSVIGTVANVASANYANFAGAVVNNAQPNITSVGTLTGLVVGGDITPNANVTHSLGNSTNRFNDLYLSNSTIYLGAQEISANASATIFNGNVAAQNFIGNFIGNISNAQFANIANVAYNVSAANVSGLGNVATLNLDGSAGNVLYGNGIFAPVATGNVANANYANFAGTAYSVSGSNVSGAVANATFANDAGNANIANTAYAVNGANVSGSVANANYANISGSSYSVSVGNVSGIGNIATINLDGNNSNVLRGDGTFAPEGTSGNANYANFAGNAFSVDGANVNGAVANATYALDAGNANIANTAYSVAVGNVSGIGNIATINLDGNASNLLNGAGSFVAIPTSVANANYANFAGDVVNATQSNITSLGTLTSLNVSGTSNLANMNVAGAIIFANPTTTAEISAIENGANANARSISINGGNISNTLTSNTLAGGVVLQSGNATQADAGNVWLARSGTVSFLAGTAQTANGNATGGSVTGQAGAAITTTGTATGGAYTTSSGGATSSNGSATVGAMTLSGGTAQATNGNATTGNTTINSGIANATSGNSRSGNLFIRTGNAISITSGTATVGNIIIETGVANGVTANVKGTIAIGNSGNANLVTIGHANTPVTINGIANVTGNLNANIIVANYLYGDGSNITRTYGGFYNPNDIAITANTVANLDLTNTYSANGVSIVSNNQITIARGGIYNIQMSLQLTNSDNASEHDFDVWFAKNGTDVATSATQYTVIKNNGKNVAAINFVDTCVANDYYQIRYAASSANISLEAFANITTPYVRPAVPSAIVTVVPVGA